MAKKKVGHATWFKLSLEHEAVLSVVPDDCAGRAIKHALCYLSSGHIPESMDQQEAIVFALLRRAVDEANASYRKSSAAGKEGNKVRWGNQVSGGIGEYREEDTEVSSSNTKNIYTGPGLEAGGQHEDWAEREARKWMEVQDQ